MSVRWTNASVKKFAGSGDPVAKMEERARTVVLRARDSGWQGPPFDPLRLAEHLGYEVEARADVQEARVLYREEGSTFRIEFNPTRPQGRMYFSVAHEIAHTFFPDCKQRVRHRGVHESHTNDSWQIELLCNLGAAELLMPVGSFESLKSTSPTIENLLDKRREYQVSTEAILIRYAKLSEHACAAFTASLVSHAGGDRFRIDYVVPSRSWDIAVTAGQLFSAEARLAECTAIGFTAKGTEKSFGANLRVEAVGLPPYPGQISPRVAGLLWATRKSATQPFAITYVRGDALSPRGAGKQIVAHVVNDKTTNWGGGGFAVAAKRRWPDAHREFSQLIMATKRELLRLGKAINAKVDDQISLFSMVAQHGFGPSDSPRIRYAALESCLTQLRESAKASGATVHMPRIGTGNAGGLWPVIEEMINEQLVREGISVTVYDLPQ